MKQIALLPLLLVLAGPAAAEIYRSVDAQGRVTYSQTPPDGGQAKKVTPRVTPANPAAAEALRQQAQALDKARQESDKTRVEAEAKTRERTDRCGKARAGLAALDQTPPNRLYSTNAQGENEYWTTERHAEERSKLQQVAEKDCEA